MKDFPSEGREIFLLLLTFIVSFLAYWLTIESPTVRGRFEERFGRESGSLRFFVFNKLWGTLWFGVLCTLAAAALFPGYSLADFGFRLPRPGQAATWTILWSVFLVVLLVLGSGFRSRRIARAAGDFGRYPEIRIQRWTASTFLIDIGFWCLYLLAYELLFRGTLLFPLADRLGPWPAMGINVALYSAAHVPKGAGEAIGALPLGFLLCLITLSTGSVLTAFLAHAALAVSNDLFAAYYGRRRVQAPGKSAESME